MKRVVSLILCFCILFSSVTSAQAIVLPRAIREIQAEAFMGDTSITGVLDLSGYENLDSIGDRAFKDTGITGINWGSNTVSRIGAGAFENTDITGIVMAGGEVGDRAFAGTDVFAADFYGGVYGDGVLRDSGATYAVFESDDVELADGAFVNTETGEKDVLALVGPNGGTVEAYAAAKGIPYYSMESTRLVYDDQIVVEIDNTDYTARAILPLFPIVQGGTFPETFSNGEVEYPITEIGPHTFSGVEIAEGGTIVIPVGIQLPAQEERVNWPENIVVADIDLSNVQVQAQINGCAGKDYNDWYTGQYYEFHKDEGYTEDWIDFGYRFVDSDLTAAEQQVVASMIETTVIVDDWNDEDEEHDENIVRINADGRIVAVSEGGAYITYIVSLNGVELSRARATAHVLGMVPMNVPSAQLSIGEQIRLYPIVNLSDLDPLSIHYYSEDNSVADVDPETGVVTAKRPGSTKIIAEAYCYIYQKNVGDHHRICTAECVITVVDGAFNADQTNLSLYGGESCDIAFINNTDKVITDITWESSNAGAVFAKVHEDRTGATITTENGYAYPGHDRITFTATFEDGTTESVTVHVAGEVQAVYAEAEWPYYQFYTGDEPMEFQYFTYYAPGYSAENIHVYYDVEVLESNTEGAELVTVDEDGYMYVTEDASVTGVANVYAIFVHADTGRTVARIKSGVIVNQGIPAIDVETAGFAFDQETFYLNTNDDVEVYPFRVRVADDDIWNYYWAKYEVISEDDGNPDTEDDTGLVLGLYDDGCWEYFNPGTAVIRATLVPHNPGELDPSAEPVTAEATVVIDDALPYLTYETSRAGDDSGYVEEGWLDPNDKNYFYHGEINTVKLQGLPEGIGIERTEWHINEKYFSILGQDETSFSFSVIDWTQEDETLDIRVFLENGSEFFLSYPLRGCGLGDYNGIYLDPPAVTLSVGDVFTVEAYKEIWDQNNYEYHNDYNFYDPIWIDFYDQDVVVPFGGKLIDDRMPASVDEGGDEGEYEYIGLYETRQLRAVKPGETVVTVYGLFTETDGNGGEQMYQDQMDLYVNVVEPEMTLEAFEPASVMYMGNIYDPSVAISYTGLHPDMTFSFSEEGILEMDYEAWKLVPVGEGTVDVTVTATKGDLEPQSLTVTVTVYGTDMFFAEGNPLSMPAGEGGRILHIENNTGKQIDHVEWMSSDENVVMFYNPYGDSGAYTETDDGVVDVDTMTDEIGARAEISATVHFTDGTMKEIIATATVREMAFFHNDSVELVPNESFGLDWGFDGWTPDYMEFTVNYTDIVSVSAQGVITALAPGYAEVCLYAADDSTWVATYVPVNVRNFSASLEPSELNLSMGEAAYVVPTINVEEGYWINDQRTRFWSMNESVATVDHMGRVTAVAPGSTTIGYETRTFYDDYPLVAYATVNVTAKESGVLAISDRYVELHARERYQLGVTVSDNYIEEKAIESIEWVSSDEGWLSVDDTGLLYAFNWDIEEPRTVFVTANVTFTDGTTDSMICSVKLLPALISVSHSRNFYEIGVEESVPFEYAISMNQAAWDIEYDVLFSVEDVSEADKPEDERATIVTVDEDGIMTGVAPGVALVRMDVMEIVDRDADGAPIYGRNLFTGASYVYMDTPIPEPTEDSIAFEFDHYYLSRDHHGGNHAHIVDENGLGQFHNMLFTSDNDRVVTINNGGWMEPSGNGTTTIHAWFEGYEEYAISARVTVGTPELTFGDAELDENGNPVITVGDVLTVKIENMPPFGNMREDQIQPNHINLNVDDSMLREMGRSDEENTISFLAVGEGWTEGGVEVNVNNDRNFDMGFGVSIHGGEAEFTMDERALVMAEGEIVQLWPHSDWEEDWAELISFSSDNEDILTITEGTRCLLLKGEAQGTATVTAQYRLNDERVITTTTVVGVGPYYWNVSFDNIPSVLYVGDRYEPWPIMNHGTYYEPEHGNWHISDESVAGIEEHDDDVWLVARQPGEFTLSMTFSMDNPGFDFAEQTTVMKTITVVERPYSHIEFAENEVEVRPGESFFVPLRINTDWQIRNVQYWSEDEGLVTVRNMLDDPSYPEEFPDYDYNRHGEAVIITGVKANNSTRVFALAEFDILQHAADDEGNFLYNEDGSPVYVQATDDEGNLLYNEDGSPVYVVDGTHTAYASMRVKPIEDDNVYLNIHGFDGMGDNPVRVTNQYWGDDSGEALVWLNYETNAAVYGNGEDILTLNWSVDDPNVAAIWDEEGNVRLEGYGVPQNGLWITGLNPGGTALRLNAVIWRHVYDEEGNVQYNEDGSPVMNVLCEENREYWIEVEEPHLDVWFNSPHTHEEDGTPVYELHGVDNRCGLSWQIDEYRAKYPLTEKIWVDDTSVATVGANGELISVAPGETRVRVCVETENGYGVENEAIVRVYGNEGDMGRVDIGFYDGQTTIAAGESAALPYYLFDNGYQIHNQWWSTSDETVATVSKDGVVYGVGRGYAVITFYVDTEYGWQEAQCMVEVTGDGGQFWTEPELLTLYRGSSDVVALCLPETNPDPLGVILSITTPKDDMVAEEVETNSKWVIRSIHSDDPILIAESVMDESGKLALKLTATDWDNAKTLYVPVTVEVEDYNGENLSSGMLVVLPEQRLRIAGHQFGEGRWEHLGLHDWNNPLTIREQYITSDPDMHVEVEVTVDMAHDYDEDGRIIRTYPVIVWDPECGGYIGVNVGETTMHYTVTADSGESYTADLKVFVGGEDRMPDELKIREGCEYIVTALGDNNRRLHEVIDWPEYKGCELAYKVTKQQPFTASEGNVINLGDENDNGRIYTENAGIATVRIYCPYNESLSTQVQVLVFDPVNVVLTRVDECEDPSIVKTGETVHLGFHNAEGGAVIWDELGIHAETRQMRGNDEYWITSEDGMSFTCYFWDGEFGHEVGVRFPDGYEWNTDYRFTMDKEGFFRVRLNNYPQEEAFVGNPMERSDGGLGWDSTIEEDYHVFWESENPEIAFVNADGSIQLSGDVTFTEENPSVSTNIIGIARRWVGEGERDFDNLDAWEEIARDSFPVRIIEPTAPNFDINTNGVQTVVVGDKLHMWISEYDEKTNAPTHWFTSSDENKLQFTGNYGEFLALAPGKVTITCEASNGFTAEAIAATTVKKTITIHVVEAEPKIWLPGVDMRPGQTYTQYLGYEQNGSAREIASVQWMLADGENPIVTLTPGYDEANGHYVTLTDGVVGGNDLLFAIVTFADGRTVETSCNVYVRPDEDVYVWGWHDDAWLSADAVIGANPVTGTAWLHFDTHAALVGSENPGTDTASVTWELVAQWDEHGNELDVNAEDYQPIVTLVGTKGDWNEGAVVQANGIVGSAELKATIRVYNAAGEELDVHEEWVYVHVEPSCFNVWFDGYDYEAEDGNPVYEISAAAEEGYRLIGWKTEERNVTGNRRVIFWSDDTSVVTTDIHGNVQVVAPGETFIHVAIIFGEGDETRTFEASARVFVPNGDGDTRRVEVGIHEDGELTVSAGQTLKLNAYVNDNGIEIYHQYWYTNNPSVVRILDDGTVAGLMPGVAEVKYCVDTAYGQVDARRIITVTGDDEAFRLGENVITLFTENSADLDIINETGLEISDISISVTNGAAMTAELMTREDGSQYVRVYAQDWGTSMVKYEVLTVTANAEGMPVEATCQVIIPEQRLRIIGDPFEGENNWWAMASGERVLVQSQWVVSDPSLEPLVQVEITSDDPEIAYYDGVTGEIVGVSQGETVITYTASVMFPVMGEDGEQLLDSEGNPVYNAGETRVRKLTVFVDMDRTPENVVPMHNPQVAFLDWGEAHLELDYQPFMTHTHTQFFSQNPDILTFDDEHDTTKMTLHNEGLAYVDVMFPDSDHLNFTTHVLVINQDNVQVRRVDVAEDDDPYRIGTLERAHVAFTDSEGNAPIWERYGIPVEYVFDAYEDGYVDIEVDENNQIFLSTTYTHTDSHISHQFGVHFYDDVYLYKNYEYWIDPDVLFSFAFMDSTDGYEYVGVVGERSQTWLAMCENYGTLYEKTFGEDYVFRFESDNSSVAQVDEEGFVTLTGEGETTLHVIACEWILEPTEEDPLAGYRGMDIFVNGEQLRASLPVRVLAPYAPNFHITSHDDVRVLNVGEELQLYINAEDDPSTYVPQHRFESCDLSVLVPVLNEDGDQEYGLFRAVAPGFVTVNATAWNGYDSEGNPIISGDSMEFLVVGKEPDVWTNDIAVRPGQTFTMPVLVNEEGCGIHLNDNGTGVTVTSVTAVLADPLEDELDETLADIAVTEGNAVVITNAHTLTTSEGDPVQDTQLIITITLSDGTEHERVSNLHVTVDEELFVAPYHYDVHLSTVDWGEQPVEDVVWQSWHHNAAFFDEENPGADQAWIEWSIDDESIAQFTGEMFVREDGTTAPWNNGPMIKAISEGETVIRTKLWVKNADGEVLIPHDENGNPYTDDEGHVLNYVTDEIPVYVHVPSVDFGFNEHELQMTVGARRHVGITENIQHAAAAESVTFTSSNPAVAAMDVNNHVIAYAPGETTITMTMNIRGEMFTDELRVIVEGVDAKLSETEITIERGGYAKLDLLVTGDYQAHNVWFESLDHGIATVNNDGYVYGVETGATAVICYVEHDYGTLELPCVVHVAGTEDDDLVLSTHYAEISAFGEQMISYEYTGEGTPVSVRWHSTNEDYLFVGPITSGGQMTNRAMLIGYGGEIERDHYVTLYCFLTVEKTAEDGSTYTEEEMDVCLVKVNKAGIRIANHQFGPGQWGNFNIGETEGIWERYIVTDQTFCRIETVVSIERGGENVAVYDEAEGVIRAVGKGKTIAFFTVNGYKLDGEGNEYLAETCTDRREICVEIGGAPEVQYARYTPQVALLQEGEGHLQIISEPDYTGCYTTFTSRNPEIITFDNSEEARFTIHGTGMAEVDVVCPDFEHLNFTAQVMVMDMDVLKLARVDVEEGEDPYIVRPYETVQLGFWQEYTDENGSVTNVEAPLWEQYGIPVRFEPHRNYDPNRLYVTEDLKLTTTWTDFNEEIHHWVSVIFGEGDSEQRFDVCYPFHIVQEENFFRAVLQDDDRAIELVMNPGDRFCMDYRTNIEWQDNYSVEYYIGWDEYGNEYDNLAIYNGNEVYARYNGEGMVYARLVEEIPDENGDGAFYYTIAEDSFPVRVIDPQVPIIRIDPAHGNTVRMGDTVQLYLAHENENTFAPYHEYFSMDEEILEQVVDGEGNPVHGLFRAVGLGTTQIKAEAYYGYQSQGCWAEISENFSVIPGNASVSFEQDYVEMRPGQTMILPVHFNANGSDGELSGYTVSVTDDNIISAEMIELDGTDAVRVTRLAVSGDAQVNVQAMLADGSTRGASCTIGVASDIYLNLPDQTIFLYTDEADGPTEAEVYLTWETNAAFAGDENPGTDTLWIDWSIASANIAVSDDIGADTATNNGVHVTAVAQGLTSFTGYVTVKDVYGTVIAEGEAKVSVYVCSDNVDISLVDAPDATEYVGNVGDAVQIRWNTEQWSSEEGLPEGYSVLYKEVDQYGIGTGVVTVDQYGWFYPQMEGETNIQVRIREEYRIEGNENTYYRTVAAGTFPIRIIEPETPNITITSDLGFDLQVGQVVQLGITYDNTNTFAPWYYFEGTDGGMFLPVYDEEGDEILGLYEVIGSGQTTVTAIATYGTSTNNRSNEAEAVITVTAGQPDMIVNWDASDMRPGQKAFFPVYYRDNESGVGMVDYEVNVDTLVPEGEEYVDVLRVEKTTLEDGTIGFTAECLSAAYDADVFVSMELDNGDIIAEGCLFETVDNSDVTVEAYDGEIWLSDASFGADDHETYVYIDFGTNAAVAGDPNRNGTDYVQITDWRAENPEGMTVITTAETASEDGNGLFVRGEAPGTAKLYATVNLYAQDGTFLAKDEAVITVHVSEATMNVWFSGDSYGYSVGYGGWIGVNRSSHVMADAVIRSSSDENVFTVDIWGNITPVGPGTATYTVTYVYGDKEFSASTQIEVWGVELRLLEKEITIEEGESCGIPYVLNENGYVYGDAYKQWSSSDNGIAMVTDDGKVYAVAPGTAVITFVYSCGSEYFERTCLVHVTGEESGLVLSDNALTVYPSNTAQLTYAYVGEGALDENSIVWSSSEDWITVENGLVTAIWQDNTSEDFRAVITCEAQVNMGTDEEPDWQKVSDTCCVTMPAPKVWIGESQFYEGSWFELEIGDAVGLWENYTVTDGSLIVEETISVDHPEVAVYEEEFDHIRAVGNGIATATYTLTAYRMGEDGQLVPTGESYTRTMAIVVGQNTKPAEVKARYATQLIDITWGNSATLEIEYVPQEGEQYAYCNLLFESDNHDVVSFRYEEDPFMEINGEGVANITITCPEDPTLSTTAKVLVVNSDALQLVTLEGNDTNAVRPYEPTKIGFRNLNWDDEGNVIRQLPIWEREGIEVGYRVNTWSDDQITITDDLTLTLKQIYGNRYVNVAVLFGDGQELHMGSHFYTNTWDPYLVATVNGNWTEVTANPGDMLGIGWHDNLYSHYGNCSFDFASSNPEVASVESGWIQCYSLGEAKITVIAKNEAGETVMTSDIEVSVVAPQTPDFWIVAQNRAVKLGQTIQLSIDHARNQTNAPNHSFTSLNTDVLEQVYDEYGNERHGEFRAVGFGEAVIRAEGSYGYGEDRKTSEAFETFYVIPGDPELVLETEDGKYTLRPGQTRTMTVRYKDNGSGVELAENPEYSMWVDYGDSVTVTDNLLEDGTYTITVTTHNTDSSPLINVKAKLSDGSEVVKGQWMDMVNDWNVYLKINHDQGISSAEICDETYGIYEQYADFRVAVDTNAYLEEGADQLEITWWTDNPSAIQLDTESVADQYGNGVRVTGVKDTSGSGNVYADVKLTTASGNVYQNQLNFWVSVYDTYCNIRFDRDAYELITGDTAYLDLYPQFSMTLHQVERLIYVDDPSVAQVYDSQYVRAVAPGTANIICRVVFEDGTYVENRAPVTVRGMKLAWADGSDEPVTLQVDGEPVRLATAVEWYPEDIGYANGGVWDSYNSNVVSIDWETGEMTAVAPGTAVISFTQQAMYEGGYGSESTIYRTVIVEGENPPVSLSETQITLAGESKHQLEVIVHDDSHGELTEVRWNAWDHTLVDENGLVSVNSDYRVFYGTVTATAVFEDGFEYTATCTVKVNPRRFNLYGWQFSIAGWTWMAYNSMYAYRDMVEVFDNNVDVEMTFESSDESIATVDENGNIYSYDKAGDADITMTLKGYVDGVYTGESYVRNFRVRVEVDTTPSWIEYGNNKTWVLPLQYDYYLPYEVEAYTSFRPSMSTDNVDVATFAMSDSTQVLINGTGEANLTMAVEGHPEIRDTAKVIIVDPSRFSIAAEDGRTEFSEDEEVQLVVNGLEGLEDEVSTICWYSEACNDDFNMESDGLLVALGNYDNGELSSVSAEIIFNCGTSISVPAFSFDIVW